jgi:hypothetical protein
MYWLINVLICTHVIQLYRRLCIISYSRCESLNVRSPRDWPGLKCQANACQRGRSVILRHRSLYVLLLTWISQRFTPRRTHVCMRALLYIVPKYHKRNVTKYWKIQSQMPMKEIYLSPIITSLKSSKFLDFYDFWILMFEIFNYF